MEDELDREGVRREIASFHGLEPAELDELDEFRIGGVRLFELPEEPIVIRAEGRSDWSRKMALSRSRSDPAGAWMVQEYEKLARDVADSSTVLTLSEGLQPPRYTFGLETRTHVLWLHAGTEPQLFTVSSRGGELLAEGIALDELERRFPEFAGFERLGETDLSDY